MPSSVAIIASVDPQQTVTCVSGSMARPWRRAASRAMACAQLGRAPGDGVLVDVGVDGARRRGLDRLGRGEVGEPLRQVDRAVPMRQPGHLADDRFGEAGGLAGDPELRHARAPVRGRSTVIAAMP